MPEQVDVHALQQATVWDNADRKLGVVGQVHQDPVTGTITWITVGLGLADSREKFVPINGARIEKHDVFVAYSHDTIKDSPSPAASDGLTPEEEAELRRYYGTER
jgi:hypothetical protein